MWLNVGAIVAGVAVLLAWHKADNAETPEQRRPWLIVRYGAVGFIVLWLIIYGVIVTGAVVGGGFFLFLHKRQVGETVSDGNIKQYILLSEFAALEELDEDRVLGRIRSRYYRGGRYDGTWYVHQSELTNKPID